MVEIQRLRAVPAHCKNATALFERIDEILALIPENFPKKDKFEECLKYQQGMIFHTPTEEIYLRQEKIERVIMDFLPVGSELEVKFTQILRLVHDD